jgi:hypothetical protein
MLRLKANRFSYSQAGTVNCLEQNPMFEIADAGKETCDLLHAEDSRQFSASWTGRQAKTVINFSVADVSIEVSDATEIILA